MALTRNVDLDRVRRAIVSGVVRICEEMSIDVIAEGIETPSECLALQDEGITLFQNRAAAKTTALHFATDDWIARSKYHLRGLARRRIFYNQRLGLGLWVRIAQALAASLEPSDRDLSSAILRYLREMPVVRRAMAQPTAQRELPCMTRSPGPRVTPTPAPTRKGPEMER
jgi:hypothetical protein